MTRFTHLTLEIEDGVATVLMDRADQAVNTLGPPILDDFRALLERLETDPGISAVVWGSAKPDFLVGADIRWFSELDHPAAAEEAIRTAQPLLDRLERLGEGKPVIAAIHGACLGGGLEVALCATYRMATDHPRTQLGQPEVRLGVIPAGGGTQRLPALIGVAPALDLILGGKPAGASKARRLGLVHEVVDPEVLLEAAHRVAAGAVPPLTTRRPALSIDRLQALALEANPVGRSVLFSQARSRLLAETKGNYPAPERALEAVRIGLEEGREQGLAAEARFFGELVVSPESKALRSIFLATRELEKERHVPADVEPRHVGKVAVLGGGLMGGGIAAVTTLRAEATVRVKEVDDAGVGRALRHVAEAVDERARRGRLSAFEAERARLRVTADTAWRGFADADLVIEAVFEDLELKRSILAEVEGIVSPETVYGSNTSSLPITGIVEGARHPERVLGMHYFSPVERMPLLEIVVTDETADWALATAVEMGRRQGRTVIVVNDGTGFYTTRIFGPYTNEAMFLLDEGASVEAIDAAMLAWGFPVGPLLLADEVGMDVGAKIARILVEAYGPRMAGPEAMAGLIADERHGRKNRRGFYRYDEDGKRGGADETVYEALGLGPRREVSRGEIQRRISLAMIAEAIRCLGDGILRTARDGDIGAVMGLGFPPFRGGPFWYVDQVGPARVLAELKALTEAHGDRFAPPDLLRDVAVSDEYFRP